MYVCTWQDMERYLFRTAGMLDNDVNFVEGKSLEDVVVISALIT